MIGNRTLIMEFKLFGNNVRVVENEVVSDVPLIKKCVEDALYWPNPGSHRGNPLLANLIDYWGERHITDVKLSNTEKLIPSNGFGKNL